MGYQGEVQKGGGREGATKTANNCFGNVNRFRRAGTSEQARGGDEKSQNQTNVVRRVRGENPSPGKAKLSGVKRAAWWALLTPTRWKTSTKPGGYCGAKRRRVAGGVAKGFRKAINRSVMTLVS